MEITKSHNKKKLTKKQAMENIINHYENSLKENYIKNIMIGFKTASQMYLDKVNDGCTMEELKDFIKKNVTNKEILEKIVGGKYVETSNKE